MDPIQTLADLFGTDYREAKELYGTQFLNFNQESTTGEPCSNVRGKRIHLHRDAPDIVQMGETWAVRVERTPSGHEYAFPIQKIDANFMVRLNPETKTILAQSLLEETPDEILAALGPKIEEIQGSEKTQLLQRINELTTEKEELEAKLETYRSNLASALKEMEALREIPKPKPKKDAQPEPDFVPHQPKTKFNFRRPQPDTISSPDLRDGGYFLHTNLNQDKLYLKWHPRGPFQAKQGILVIPQLSLLLSPDRTGDLNGRYDNNLGRIVIDITYTPTYNTLHHDDAK